MTRVQWNHRKTCWIAAGRVGNRKIIGSWTLIATTSRHGKPLDIWIVPRRPVGAIGLTLVAYRHSENGSTRIRPVRSRIAVRHVSFGLEQSDVRQTRRRNREVARATRGSNKVEKGNDMYSGHVLPSCLPAFHVRTTFLRSYTSHAPREEEEEEKKKDSLSFVLTSYDESHGCIFVSARKKKSRLNERVLGEYWWTF